MSRPSASLIGKLGAVACIAMASIHALAEPMAGTVIDANGIEMGPYYPSLDTVKASGVLVSLGGEPVLLKLHAPNARSSPLGLVPDGNEMRVFFESEDCTGQAWVEADGVVAAGTSRAAILANKQGVATVYLPSQESPEKRKVKSWVLGEPATCHRRGQSTALRRVGQVIDLSSLYALPYRVQ